MPSGTPQEEKVLTEADITTADEWGMAMPADTGFVLELPSGRVIKARRTMNMLTMLQQGQIPNPLREIVLEQMKGGGDGSAQQFREALSQSSDSDGELLMQFNDFMNRIVCDTVVQPPVDMPAPRGQLTDDVGELIDPDETIEAYQSRLSSWTPRPGAVSVFLVDVVDKMFLFGVAQGGVTDVKRFRSEQEAALAAMADEQGARSAPQRAGGSGKTKPKKSTAKAKKSAAKKAAVAKRSAAAKSKSATKKAPAKKSAAKKRS